eukprot:3706726-Amphidinium_carterae.1
MEGKVYDLPLYNFTGTFIVSPAVAERVTDERAMAEHKGGWGVARTLMARIMEADREQLSGFYGTN